MTSIDSFYRNVDLYQIRYFLAIAETGNFTKAAERLFVSQPSLSAGIRKLEKELGVTLFERGGRKVLLTTAGHFFLDKARNILTEYQDALHQLRGFKDRPTLKLGTLHTIRSCVLARLIGAYRDRHPHVAIELFNGQQGELIDWLDTGKIDLAIGLVERVRDGKSDKTTRSLFQQRLLLAVPATHPFAQRSSLRLSDLNDQPYIQRLHCEIWQACPQMFETAKVRPQIVYRADHEDWVISLIQVGLGMSIMPVWAGLPHLSYIPIVDLDLERTIGLRWRSQQDSVVVNEFCVFATSHNWSI